MTYVKHVPGLMAMLFAEVRRTFDAEDWNGLRQSHFRVIDGVPEDGISVTDLSRRLGMSKQGCGQFVTHLVDLGHLRVDADPVDRRVRRVHRTALSRSTLDAVAARILEIEREWSRAVGATRYREFRAVLEELAGRRGDISRR